MKQIAYLATTFLCLLGSSNALADVIASNDFDSPLNLTSSSSSPVPFNSFTSAADAWGIYDFNTGGPFALFDDTVAGSGGGDPFPTDSLGIVQSTKTDNFFGISDTTNGDVADGEMTGEWVFDISSAAGGLASISVDFAGMGDFEASDILTVSYSIDGGIFTDIFTSSVDELGSKNYTMENGNIEPYDDPISMNGVELGNSFDTVTANVSGSGSELTLRVFTDTNGGTEVLGFDNIVINGIPEPSTVGILGLVLAGFVFRRRRK